MGLARKCRSRVHQLDKAVSCRSTLKRTLLHLRSKSRKRSPLCRAHNTVNSRTLEQCESPPRGTVACRSKLLSTRRWLNLGESKLMAMRHAANRSRLATYLLEQRERKVPFSTLGSQHSYICWLQRGYGFTFCCRIVCTPLYFPRFIREYKINHFAASKIGRSTHSRWSLRLGSCGGLRKLWPRDRSVAGRSNRPADASPMALSSPAR